MIFHKNLLRNLFCFGIFIDLCKFIAPHQRQQSAVIELNEKFLDVKDEGLWFVEFYAPWCGHCKKLHPTWEQVAIALADSIPKLRVGRLDCTRFTDVSSKLSIHGFPTIKFFRNGVEFTYEGDRTREALVEYASKLEGPEVRYLASLQAFQQLYNHHYIKGGFFVLVAPQDDDSELKKEFRNVSQEMFSKAYFAEIQPENLPENITPPVIPAVFTIKDNTYYVYTENKKQSLKSWIESERWPLMPLITYGNLYEIGLCCDKLLVLTVSHLVERATPNSEVKRFHDLVKETAKSHYQELHEHFQFGWTDGNELASGIALKAMPIPNLLVFNVSSYQYYLPDDKIEHITKESLVLFFQSVVAGDVPVYGGRGILQKMKRVGYELYSTVYNMFATQPLLSCCLFGLPLGILSVICYTLCSADMSVDRDEIYKESDDSGDDETDHDKRD